VWHQADVVTGGDRRLVRMVMGASGCNSGRLRPRAEQVDQLRVVYDFLVEQAGRESLELVALAPE
jgi:hypothetical protein